MDEPELGGATSTGAAGATSSLSKLGSLGTGKTVVALALIGAAVVVGLGRDRERDRGPSAASTEPSKAFEERATEPRGTTIDGPPSSSALPPAEPANSVEPAKSEVPAMPSARAARGRTSAARPVAEPRAPEATAPEPVPAETRASDRSLVEERALLDAARVARARGDDEGAIAVARAHEARYPNGQLADEREAILIVALAHAKRMGEARARAERFRARRPRSILLPVIDSALGGSENGSPR